MLAQFYYDSNLNAGEVCVLDEPTSKHIIQVLRMALGDTLQLTNGKGALATVAITDANRKRCAVTINEVTVRDRPKAQLHLGIAFTRNAGRNEWLLEKATELGVTTIIPLITTRTMNEKVKQERWQNILVSAMLQSQQQYLPHLSIPMQVKDLVKAYGGVPQKYMAHCIVGQPRRPLAGSLQPATETIILIGPEGDFTEEEVALCIASGFTAVTLGAQRLRTETAGMAACAYFNLLNDEEGE